MLVWCRTKSLKRVLRDAKTSSFAAWAIGIVLLIGQPLLFFSGVLFNPRKHIPYDIEGFHLPLAAYIARCVREHVLPLWAPYPYCGVPIHADIQAQLFYPLTWISLLLGNLSAGHKLFYWIEWQIPLHMILAGLFTFFLLRYLGLAMAPAFFGATVYQLGGFFASQAQHLGAICCGAWLPLVLLSVFKLKKGVTATGIAMLAVGVALSVLSGFIAATVVVLASAAMATIALVPSVRTKFRFVASVLGGVISGLGLSAIQLIPTYQLTGLSVASERAQADGTGGGLEIQSLASLVWPNYYHIFTPFDASRFKLDINFTFLYVYCGILTVLLVLAAPMMKRAIHARLFFGLTVISAVWMLGEETPVYRWVFTHLPRLVRGALYAEEALMAFCMFAALTAAVVLHQIGRKWPAPVLWAIALLTSADLIYFGADRPMNTGPGGYKAESNEYKLNGEAALLAQMQALVNQASPPMRIDYLTADGFPSIIGAAMLKLPTPDGDNPLALKRVIALRRLFCGGNSWERKLPVTRPGSPLLNLLNVGFLAGSNSQPPGTGLQLPVALETGGVRIYRNGGVLPRFFLVRWLHFAGSAADALSYLGRPGFQPAEEAVVETKSLSLNEPLSTGDVQIERYSANRIQLRVITTGSAFLASSEVLYPGWTVKINNKNAPFYMTNGAFRGIVLNAGTNRIVMEYWPGSLTAGAIVSALSAVLLIAGLVLPRRFGGASGLAHKPD
jgi:hypothetical protein